jgi:hypothetical protein
MKLDFTNPKGLIPRTDPKALPEGYAQVAVDLDLFGNNWRPIRASKDEESLAGTATETIFPHGEQWFTWDSDVDVHHTPVNEDQYNRIYYTGDGLPKVQSLVDTTYTIYDLKVDNPANTPTVTETNVGSGTATSDAQELTYVYTFVTAWGEETVGSTASAITDISADSDVTVGNLETSVSSGRNVTKKRIYRNDVNGQFRFVAEIDLADATFTDTIAESALGEIWETADYEQPNDDLKGLTPMAGGVFAGFINNVLYFCEPYQPHAWPTKYSLNVDQDIVGLASTGNTLLVATKGSPYIVIGHEPNSFSITKLEIEQSCVSKKSVTDVGNSMVYASPVGLVRVSGGDARLITQALFTKDEWRDLTPSSMICELYDRSLIMATSQKVLMLDMDDRGVGMTELSNTHLATGMYKHTTDDVLYFINNTDQQIQSFDTGAQECEFTWKSGIISSPYPISWGVVRVQADSHPVAVTLYSEESDYPVATIMTRDNEATRLPLMRREKHWSIEISSRHNVDRVTISTRMGDL